jgi:hypothetical protein
VAAEIKTIHGGSKPGEPSAELVETLEYLLKDAKSGELVALGYATVRNGKVKGTGWDGMAGTRDTLGSAINMLHHRYTKALLDGD